MFMLCIIYYITCLFDISYIKSHVYVIYHKLYITCLCYISYIISHVYVIYYIPCLCYISYIISPDTVAPLNIADLTPPKEKVLPIPEGSAFFCFSKTNP